MNKNLSISAAVLAVAVLAGAVYLSMKPGKDAPTPVEPASVQAKSADGAASAETPEQAERPAPGAFDPKNSSFILDGQSLTLKDGAFSVPAASGSASSVTTRYFGKDGRGDLNNDGKEDIAFIVTQETGGSGLFYYAVAAIRTGDEYKTTNAFLIGDRVAVQSLIIPKNSNELHVNFAERRPDEPMTAPPSVDAVLLLKVTPKGVLEGLMK